MIVFIVTTFQLIMQRKRKHNTNNCKGSCAQSRAVLVRKLYEEASTFHLKVYVLEKKY